MKTENKNNETNEVNIVDQVDQDTLKKSLEKVLDADLNNMTAVELEEELDNFNSEDLQVEVEDGNENQEEVIAAMQDTINKQGDMVSTLVELNKSLKAKVETLEKDSIKKSHLVEFQDKVNERLKGINSTFNNLKTTIAESLKNFTVKASDSNNGTEPNLEVEPTKAESKKNGIQTLTIKAGDVKQTEVDEILANFE